MVISFYNSTCHFFKITIRSCTSVELSTVFFTSSRNGLDLLHIMSERLTHSIYFFSCSFITIFTTTGNCQISAGYTIGFLNLHSCHCCVTFIIMSKCAYRLHACSCTVPFCTFQNSLSTYGTACRSTLHYIKDWILSFITMSKRFCPFYYFCFLSCSTAYFTYFAGFHRFCTSCIADTNHPFMCYERRLCIRLRLLTGIAVTVYQTWFCTSRRPDLPVHYPVMVRGHSLITIRSAFADTFDYTIFFTSRLTDNLRIV